MPHLEPKETNHVAQASSPALGKSHSPGLIERSQLKPVTRQWSSGLYLRALRGFVVNSQRKVSKTRRSKESREGFGFLLRGLRAFAVRSAFSNEGCAHDT